MKIMVLRAFSLFALACFTNAPAVLGADTNPPPRLTVELRDGSRVVGTSVEKNLKFHSALLGDFKLSVADVRSVECVKTNSAKLVTVNGDELMVSFVDSAFAVKTSFGKVELAATSVRKFSISASRVAGGYLPGLVALWSGEDDGNDAVGGNTATLTDIVFVEGKVGRAFSFNGTSSTIRIPASSALDIGAGDGFTITAWINPADVQGLHPLVQWSDNNPLNLWIGIRPFENGVLRGDITDEVNHFVVSRPGVLIAGVFQHVAFTYDKVSGMGTLYLNGVVVAQRQLGRQLAAHTKGDLWFSQIDRRPGNWSTDRAFAGLIDEVALYNRALSAAEIHTLCTTEQNGEPLATPVTSAGWLEGWMR